MDDRLIKKVAVTRLIKRSKEYWRTVHEAAAKPVRWGLGLTPPLPRELTRLIKRSKKKAPG